MRGKLRGAVVGAVLGLAAAPAAAQAQSPGPLQYVEPDGTLVPLGVNGALPIADLAPRLRFGRGGVRYTFTPPSGPAVSACSADGTTTVPYAGSGVYGVRVELFADAACAGPSQGVAADVPAALAEQGVTTLVPLPARVIRRSYAVVDASPPYRTRTNTTPVLFGAVAGAGAYRVALTGPDGRVRTQDFATPDASPLRLPPPGAYALTASASPSAPGTPGAVFSPPKAATTLRVLDEFAPVARLSGTVRRRGRGFALGTRATRIEVRANPQLGAGERVTLALSRLHGDRFGHFETVGRPRIAARGAARVARATVRPGRQGIYRLRVSYSGGALVARRALVVYVLRLT